MVQDSERTDPVLAITGESSDDVVDVDGERFAMRRTSSLSLRDRRSLIRAMKRIEALENLEEPSEADELEYGQQLDTVVVLALPDLPAERRARLTTEQKADLATAFFARTAQRSERMRMLRDLRNPNGSTSSPSSPASTAVAS